MNIAAELMTAYAAIDDLDAKVERLNATIERVKAMLDEQFGSSAEMDDFIDDLHSTIAGRP